MEHHRQQRVRFFQATSTTQTAYEATTEYHTTTEMARVPEDDSKGVTGGFVFHHVDNVHIHGHNQLGHQLTPRTTSGNNSSGAYGEARAEHRSNNSGELVLSTHKKIHLHIAVLNKKGLFAQVLLDEQWKPLVLSEYGFSQILERSNIGMGLGWSVRSQFNGNHGVLEQGTTLSYGDLGIVQVSKGNNLYLSLEHEQRWVDQGVKVGRIEDTNELNALQEVAAESNLIVAFFTELDK